LTEKVDVTKYSFTSANTFPLKVLQNLPLMKSIVKDGVIVPVHLQLNPTNECNFKCGFCSCANRNRKNSLSFYDFKNFLGIFKTLGGQSTTITGGGEPLFYPEICDLLHYHHYYGLDAGMVCNGSMLHRLSEYDLDCLTWVRVSCSDELPNQTNLNSWFKILEEAVDLGRKTDWAFSYVVGQNPCYELIAKITKFANDKDFTHVRLVSDLLSLDTAENMKTVKCKLRQMKVNDSKVIYQGRKEFAHGTKKCYLSLAKPVLSAEGNLFPCCGTQYALANPSLDYEKSMCMGSMFDLEKLVRNQMFFDGSQCVKCYYTDYNLLFESLLTPLKHPRFI
jgi:organic radical activating enzyme